MKIKAFVVGVALGLGALACHSQPSTDPENNVSLGSYKDAIVRAQGNLAGIKARLERARDDDLHHAHPVHSLEWWNAQIELVADTMTLNSSALAGSNVAPVKS